ncbi:MAG: DMT family transporter [Schaalia hyovaginalis]|uniref:DMT family transporter n=1 Tax=Schaalia hyovaginalis TaxID=29316 RepID=UPI0023F6A023|nr:DMT family transporter [Schaalia hyovaginalis]MCI7513168.1 DMT family transporter [Schaalia hyovaginalis]MCI7671056.1 DMT family transporter [Schaalia hyovaginalis]MDY4262103.1 DMT family transporter [Schaalia hyovaginalis]MDY5505975.1 DMT family transporter [Schaalia hyovaginalis]
MRWGVFSGALWGLDTVILGIALAMAPFAGASQASMASALLHDAICALILFVYMGARGRLGRTLAAIRTRSGKAIALGAILGGPFGMTGYLIAINNIGPGYTAIISTFYPAVGTLLAYLFLKERMRPRQILALLVALTAIILIGYSSTGSTASGNAVLGIVAALACVLGWGSEAVILAWGMRDDEVDEDSALQIRESTSALVYLLVVAPIAGVLGFGIRAIPTLGTGVIALAALAGTASYLFYYTAINTVGASRGMALNISYSAWAVIFALLLIGTVPSVLQIVCCMVILVGTVLAATPNWKELRASW